VKNGGQMMDNYIGLMICGCMAVILVAVLFFDSRGTRNTGKDADIKADTDSKDEEDEPK